VTAPPPPAPAPAAEAKPPAPPPPAAPAKAAPPVTQAAEEPGFIDSLLENPLLLPGAGILALVLAGVGVYRLRGGGRKAAGETSFLESKMQPDSFFGASGGQRIDTHDAGGAASTTSSSSMSYSLSQLDAIGDVDPVAEADVYLAYGRDLQAEEILKEAMRSNPERLAIRTKLLEVYAKRRDTKGFELLATQMYALTKGEGDEWLRAQELGRTIDPDNPLYQPGGQPDAVVQEGDRIVEPLGASTLPQSVLPTPSTFAAQQAKEMAIAGRAAAAAGVDIDLDLDLGAPEPAAASVTAGTEDTQPFLPSVELGADTVPPPSTDAMPFLHTSPPQDAGPPTAPPDHLDFDLSDISLDLDAPLPDDKAPTLAESGAADVDLPDPAAEPEGEEGGDPLERKLELAEEFRQIGDMEGARDLLEEVLAQAEGALKAKAQNMLDSLS
jgi:pilus assembly protein FimV